MTRALHLLGVSFRTAPVAVREQLSFDRESAVAFLREAAAEHPALEAVVLSTCNRTEFVLAAPPDADPTASWLARLRRARPAARVLRDDCRLYRLEGAAAARHLFRVACGLDSAIVGDVQILGQVKDAVAMAAEAGSLGPWLGRVMEGAVRCAKRARRDTAIGHGAVGLGAVLAAMLADVPPEATLVVGAGEVAQDVVRHLRKRRPGGCVVVNRTFARAHELAASCGGTARPWDELESALTTAEAVIVATAAPTFVVARTMLERVVARRGRRPLFMIDASVPSNVEWSAGVELLDVDAVSARRDEALAERVAAIPAVEALVEREVAAWRGWQRARPVEAVIKSLYRGLDAASAAAARELAPMADVADAELSAVIGRSFRRLFHDHVRSLRDLLAAGEPTAEPAAPAVKGGILCAH
jgi:glutamyl-tRNA reductase